MNNDHLDNLRKNLDLAFNIKDINRRLAEDEKRVKEMEKREQQEAEAAAQAPQPWVPIDLYQHRQRKQMINDAKEFPKGSRMRVKAITEAIANGGTGGIGLVKERKRTIDDCEVLKKQGYADRAELAKQQYMEEKFIPAVETVIEYSSPDELLNCKEALSALDNLALGTGSMSGYTASYVRQAYGDVLGQKRGESDPAVESELERIKLLVSRDEIRTAIGAAQRLKQRIDNGETMASPEDYAVIGRVVAYAN
jgi:hypothetical protein